MYGHRIVVSYGCWNVHDFHRHATAVAATALVGRHGNAYVPGTRAALNAYTAAAKQHQHGSYTNGYCANQSFHLPVKRKTALFIVFGTIMFFVFHNAA